MSWRVNMAKALGTQFDEAVHLLTENRPIADGSSRKPALFHDLRVGIYLYERNYSDDIILAGLLHDAIEWYGISEETVRKEFGDTVADMVVACTKDDTIKDPVQKIEKIIKQCIDAGKDALIVKAADIIDSYKWYTMTQNENELLYCDRNASAIFQYKPKSITDDIFYELNEWYDTKQIHP